MLWSIYWMVKTASLCTVPKNRFYVYYQYNDKFKASNVFKHDYGFNIKNNIVVRMPWSYYNFVDKLIEGCVKCSNNLNIYLLP